MASGVAGRSGSRTDSAGLSADRSAEVSANVMTRWFSDGPQRSSGLGPQESVRAPPPSVRTVMNAGLLASRCCESDCDGDEGCEPSPPLAVTA